MSIVDMRRSIRGYAAIPDAFSITIRNLISDKIKFPIKKSSRASTTSTTVKKSTMPSASDNPKSSTAKAKKTARAVGQVMAALKNSKTETGPTMTEIVKFISSSLLNPATKRQVVTALKRGVEFGILKRHRGHYLLSEPDESYVQPVVPVKKVKLPVAKKAKLPEKVDKRAKAVAKPKRSRRVSVVHQMTDLPDLSDFEFPSPPTMSTIFGHVN